MGGKGSGGTRFGAGAKRQSEHAKWLGGDAGKRGTGKKRPVVPEVEQFEPPPELSARQLEIWERLAPHAFAERTLTRATAQAFRDLCACIVVRDGLMACVLQEGYGSKAGKHALLPEYRGMQQRVEAGLMRFRLSPMGRPLVEAEVPADPFAEFDGGAGDDGRSSTH